MPSIKRTPPIARPIRVGVVTWKYSNAIAKEV